MGIYSLFYGWGGKVKKWSDKEVEGSISPLNRILTITNNFNISHFKKKKKKKRYKKCLKCPYLK